MYYSDPEGQPLQGNFADFDDTKIRHAFIRKVYSILSFQLLVTVTFIAVFIYVHDVKHYVQDHPEMFHLALAITIVLLIILVCFENVRRSTPLNYILLIAFTLAESFLLAAISCTYDTEAVMLAAGVTCLITISLTIFAFQTKIDFTVYSGALFVILICLVFFGLFVLFFPSKLMVAVYGGVGALLFSMYLVVDTQLMLGGRHKYQLSEEEYIFAALNLYLDVINIFLYILTFMSAMDG